MIRPTFTLVDDGTIDTVLSCDECGRELRFFMEGFEEGERVASALEMAVEDHDCEDES